MRNRTKTAPREPEAETQKPEGQVECCHYWIIGSPNGPTSRGTCKFCGAEKDFHNTPLEFLLYKRDTGNSKRPGSPGKEPNGKKSSSHNHTGVVF